MRHRHAICIALILQFVALGTARAEIRYAITDLGTLDATADSSIGLGINDRGQVTGSFTAYDGSSRTFFYDKTMHTLHTLEGTPSKGFDINSRGHIAGYYSSPRSAFWYDGNVHDLGAYLNNRYSEAHGINDSDHVTGIWYPALDIHAFFYNGAMHDLGTLGGSQSASMSINSSDEIVGWSITSTFSTHAFLYDGTMHDLGTLGGSQSAANDINDNGQVTGRAYTASGDSHAFLYDGTMHDLGTLGGLYSEGLSINSSGQVVGQSEYSTNRSLTPHAFFYSSGTGMQDLNSLIDPQSGWALESATAINTSGQITGYGLHGLALQHAFLLTPLPTPEPPTGVLVVTMLTMALICRGLSRNRHAHSTSMQQIVR